MNDFAVAQPRPRSVANRVDRRSVAGWVIVAVVAYVGSAAIVRLFDDVIIRAQYAQLLQEAGPLVPVGCQRCVSGPELMLVWLTDWRAVLIWVLCAAAATTAVLISRPRPFAGSR